jgi:hypothetical protein
LEINKTEPRKLNYRFYYKWYALILAVLWIISVAVVAYLFLQQDSSPQKEELYSFGSFVVLLPALYLWWLHPKITRTIQVFPNAIKISNSHYSWDIDYNQIEKISTPFLSYICLKMRDGQTWWLSASIERIEYIWEGLAKACPEQMNGFANFEEFRIKLVQYDHHEKRKEWFFRHRVLDFINWIVLPSVVMFIAFKVQTSEVYIYSKPLYFFRLVMYALFTTITSAFVWSIIMKVFVFDKQVIENLKDDIKIRDVTKEDFILQRSKFFQLITCAVLMAFMIKMDLNLFSITKLKASIEQFNLRAGQTLVVDTRYNCVECAHPVVEGDLILFGKGSVAQILALPGEVIAQTQANSLGRSIASDTITTVPQGHVALKTGKGQEMVIIKISDLIGKLKNK